MAVSWVSPMTSLLARYQAGDRDAVWLELRQLGSRVREPPYHDDAEAVVREAMLRARHNVATLIERLGEQGYQFGDPFDEAAARRPLAPPDQHTPAFVAWLEEQFGPLPMAARLWIEIVGDVSLEGKHPAWPVDAVVDPLVVEVEFKSWAEAERDREFARAFYQAEHDAWAEIKAKAPALGPFSIDVAPDAFDKADRHGGEPYGFLVPDPCADAVFRYDGGVLMSFVEYLRLCFRRGGFAALWRTGPGERAVAARRQLAEGLLDL